MLTGSVCVHVRRDGAGQAAEPHVSQPIMQQQQENKASTRTGLQPRSGAAFISIPAPFLNLFLFNFQTLVAMALGMNYKTERRELCAVKHCVLATK